MKLLVTRDYTSMSEAAAAIISGEIIRKNTPVIGLATGGTPVGTYEKLAEMYAHGALDFSNVTSFNLDEYLGLNRENDQSYYYFMMENLFSKVNIKPENINIPDGTREDYLNECLAYEEKISNAGGIDIQLLGIGQNGHIGFNEPCDEFPVSTHTVDLKEDTIQANSRFFKDISEVPKRAVTMGIGTIMRARKILLIANGEGKAQIIKDMISGSVTPKVPASILQFHRNVTVIVDKAAAKLL